MPYDVLVDLEPLRMKTCFPRRWVAPFLIALLGAICLCGRASAAEAPAPVKPTGKCLMWKVTSDTGILYLLGSTHMAMAEMYPLPQEIEDAFAASDTLVVEVNVKKVDSTKMRDLIRLKGLYQGTQTLSATISPENWAGVQQQCERLGLSATRFQVFRPWVVGMMLEMTEVQKLGLDPKLGLEKHFIDLADDKAKPVHELESAEFQLNLQADFDPKMQEVGLAMSLADMKDLRQEAIDLTNAWIAGDAAAIDQQFQKKQKQHPEGEAFTEKLVYDRNGPLIEKLQGYLKGRHTVFAIIGCAHLVGDKGIVKILQDAGYTVEQSRAIRVAPATQPAKNLP
jgi:hypothetical protein